MKVVIGADAANDDACFLKLNTILDKIESGWHVWEIEEPDSLVHSSFLSQSKSLKEMYQQAAKRSVYPQSSNIHRKKVVITLCPQADYEFKPKVAAAYLTAPLTVIMENRNTDGQFFDSLCQVLGPPELIELMQVKPPPLKHDSPGGNGEIPSLVEHYVKEAREIGYPARVIVFTDSDARYPGDMHTNPEKVRESCANHGIPCLVLSKRTIENYIPDEAFDSWCAKRTWEENHPWVTSLMRLSDCQRDYFPMKNGFRKMNENGFSREETLLYATVSQADKDALEKGFLTGPIELLKTEKSALTPAGFRQRDGAGDLDRLVEMVMENL
ncbi:MAG: hypothetical protein JXR76_22455 [Deltaproteobacteria bacterium]|nr:hypothetical protein [Deltaproteobacteria bacterium]